MIKALWGWGSRKHLIASIDHNLRRLGLDFVDIFYHHRPYPHNPLEETISLLDHIVRSGKALYVGISKSSRTDETSLQHFKEVRHSLPSSLALLSYV